MAPCSGGSGLACVRLQIRAVAARNSLCRPNRVFENEIRPLLAAHCYSCHSFRTAAPLAGLRLDSRDGLLRGGDSGPTIVPGNPDQSRLLQLVRGEPLLMPPTGRLPEGKIDALASWIRMGAPWTDVPADQEKQSGVFDLDARKRSHRAWQPVQAGDPPAVRDSDWPANAVDRFILPSLRRGDYGPRLPPTAARSSED